MTSTTVTAMDTRRDPRQPSRFEKKKNTVASSVVMATAVG